MAALWLTSHFSKSMHYHSFTFWSKLITFRFCGQNAQLDLKMGIKAPVLALSFVYSLRPLPKFFCGFRLSQLLLPLHIISKWLNKVVVLLLLVFFVLFWGFFLLVICCHAFWWCCVMYKVPNTLSMWALISLRRTRYYKFI